MLRLVEPCDECRENEGRPVVMPDGEIIAYRCELCIAALERRLELVAVMVGQGTSVEAALAWSWPKVRRRLAWRRR